MSKVKGTLIGLKVRGHAGALAELACQVTPAGETLLFVHVLELPDNTPLDASVPDMDREAQKILRVAEQVTQRQKRKATTLVLRAHHAGKALLEEVKERKIARAVLGSHHGGKLREFLVGTTHQYLVRKALCRILLDIPVRQ